MKKKELLLKIRATAKNAAAGATERMADVILNRWHMSFLAKAFGGEDEFGEAWADLSPGTIAEKKRTERGWQSVDRSQLWVERRNQFVGQLAANGMRYSDAIERANQLAWQGEPEEGVPIGIDTQRLHKSISPDGSADQIREETATSLRLGSDVPYAKYFDANRRMKPTGDEVRAWVKESARYVRDDIAGDI